MESKDASQQEAEYAGFVDRGTQIVLQEAIQKVVETFNQTDSLEDILEYLEEMRESIHNTEDRLKEIQQREKQISDKIGGSETSVRNLLQRIQTLELQMSETCNKVDDIKKEILRLTTFFEKTPLSRMFSRLESPEEHGLLETGSKPEQPMQKVEVKGKIQPSQTLANPDLKRDIKHEKSNPPTFPNADVHEENTAERTISHQESTPAQISIVEEVESSNKHREVAEGFELADDSEPDLPTDPDKK